MPSSYWQAFTYTAVKEAIVNKLQKAYGHEIAISLRDLLLYNIEDDHPTHTISTETDTEKRKQDQLGLDMLYQAEIMDFIKVKKVFTSNVKKAYTVVWEYCSKTIQNNIETRMDFESTICDDPIALLKTIKVVMHEPERNKYAYAPITDTYKRLLNM